MKRVLIVGGGGREHALAWKLRQSPEVGEIYVAPGNGGTGALATNLPISDTDILSLVEFVADARIDLTVIGPEAPLALGLADRLAAIGHSVFGPTQAGARLETSKVYAKGFMARHGIPTAPYRVASDLATGIDAVREIGLPCAIKVDGLAAGKGVTVCKTNHEAEAALREALVEHRFGEAGKSVIVEEGLSGEEVSLLAFCDGARAVPMLPAQDHKAAFDGDRGPNTGGMGSYSPARALGADAMRYIEKTVLTPAMDGLREEGISYRGVLYAGLMLTTDGPKLLEFNVRFGDPETQSILPILDADLFPILAACAQGDLDPLAVKWAADSCVSVVCASGGYPGAYPKGSPISGLAEAAALPGITLFHAGTQMCDGACVTSGGRVLGVTSRAADLKAAIDGAYQAVRCIHFDGMHYRSDIGAKALQREQ